MPTTYAIPDGRTVMAATLYTGTSATQSISNAVNGVSMQPDFVWVKARNFADNNALFDSVRGVNKRLISNLTNAEDTLTDTLMSFNTNGFTLGADAGGRVNGTGTTYVGWQWKAGGTAVSNTAGSITSSVSANTTAGFSVVTYTASSSASTIGHGLGVAPSMIIQKNRDAVSDWGVYHISIGATKFLKLNDTAAAATNSVPWNDTTPTSTVFSIGTGYTNGNKYVAYCFAAVAGYSAFGSYVGNGSADGAFVYTGFRPRYVMIKSTGVEDWIVHDTSRNPYNASNLVLYPNSSQAEDNNPTYRLIDILSNGFKMRSNQGQENGSGITYVYAAFGENPLKYANAR